MPIQREQNDKQKPFKRRPRNNAGLETVQGFFVLTKSPPFYVHHPRMKKKNRVAKRNIKRKKPIYV